MNILHGFWAAEHRRRGQPTGRGHPRDFRECANGRARQRDIVTNIGSLSEAIGETNKAATSVLTASTDLTSTAETLSREVDKFFRNLRAGPVDRHDDGAVQGRAAAG